MLKARSRVFQRQDAARRVAECAGIAPTELEFGDEDPVQDEVQAAMDSLSEKYALILRLFYFRDMKIREIGLALYLSDSAVKMRLCRARECFARGWQCTPQTMPPRADTA